MTDSTPPTRPTGSPADRLARWAECYRSIATNTDAPEPLLVMTVAPRDGGEYGVLNVGDVEDVLARLAELETAAADALRKAADRIGHVAAGRVCNDSTHDDRWCWTCKGMRDGMQVAATLLRTLADEHAEPVAEATAIQPERALIEHEQWVRGLNLIGDPFDTMGDRL